MDEKKIKKRIEEIKKDNDKLNEEMQKLERQKSEIISKALLNNGRLLELEEMLKKGDK
jgi:hypothetical protein